MTYFDRRDATEDAARDLTARYGRFCNRARAEDANSTAEYEPVEIDPMVADRVALIMGRLSMPVSAIL